MKLIDKDEKAKKIAIEAGQRASRDALAQGLSEEQQKDLAQKAILKALKEFKPTTVTAEKGVDNALKIRDQFIE